MTLVGSSLGTDSDHELELLVNDDKGAWASAPAELRRHVLAVGLAAFVILLLIR